MSDLGSIVAEGLTWGMATFLVASGLTLVFGILHILNFSHGAFFAVGAYLVFTAVGPLGGELSLLAYGGVSLMAAVAVALLGLLTDATVFRRLRGVPDAYVLIATYALLLVVNGGLKLVWGLNPLAVPPPAALAGAVFLGDTIVPSYDLFIIGCGVVVFAGLDVLLRRTRFGQLMAAVGMDPWAARLLGVDVGRVYTVTLMIGFGLAGLAGGLLAANQSLQPGMGDVVIIQAFGVIIVGGTGSVRGAFAAAILLGLVQAAGNAFVPQYPGVFFFVGLGAMLLLRPDGLAGRGARGVIPLESRLGPFLVQLAGVTAVAGCVPLVANGGIVFLAGLVCINAVVALAFNLLFTTAGLMSFGQALFVAAGAYTAGLAALHWPGLPFPLALLLAGVVGALAAGLVGVLALRRSEGVSFAMLTLTFAELLHIVITKTTFLGRNDGLTGIPRPVLLAWPVRVDLGVGNNFYGFIVAVCAVLCLVLWWASHSRYGRTLAAVRMDPQRAAFLSIDVHRYRMSALMLSGAVTAVATGLYGPWTQILTPDLAYWPQSTIPLLNTLLGGAGAFWGPAAGAVAFALLDYQTRNVAGAADLVAGGLLLAVVLAIPGGLAGIVLRLGSLVRRPAPVLKRRPT